MFDTTVLNILIKMKFTDYKNYMVKNKADKLYPTYTFEDKNRDIVLIEFEEAQKLANGQTRIYGQVTNILLAVLTILIPFFFNQDSKEINKVISIKENALLFSTVIFLFGGLLLRYFVDLQRQITINARKVVTLRTMLGLDYGNTHLTLPNWRVEGATNPFSIKYFNGWLKFQSMPFWVLTIGVNAIWLLTAIGKGTFTINIFNNITFTIPWYLGNILIVVYYVWVFRRNLNDIHETSFLNIGRYFAKLLRFRLVPNFEYTIYTTKLEVLAIHRLNINYDNLKSILIKIEDQNFRKNSGVSIKSLIRAAASQIKFLKKRFNLIESGGSTITMQLARTLFIHYGQNKYIRKIFEIWIAVWLNSKFTKDEILNMYIATVRYDYGVMGLTKALNRFYQISKETKLSPEESFVLVERLSNISGTYKKDRIDYLKKRISIDLNDIEVENIYKNLIQNNMINIESY